MDVETLLQEAKARFSHSSAKHYLREKYFSKLIIAEQGGLWKADKETISFLNAFDTDKLILMDSFNNPVQVNRKELLSKLVSLYTEVMYAYYQESIILEGKR